VLNHVKDEPASNLNGKWQMKRRLIIGAILPAIAVLCVPQTRSSLNRGETIAGIVAVDFYT
jgi:hypothetical protein